MCCRANSSGVWEELLCFHQGAPLPPNKVPCHYRAGFKGNCFPSGITLDCFLLVSLWHRYMQRFSKRRCNRVCCCLLSLHTVYLLGPQMRWTLQKQKWWGARKEEKYQDPRGSAPIFWLICPPSECKAAATQTRYWIECTPQQGTAVDIKETEKAAVLWFMSYRFDFGI